MTPLRSTIRRYSRDRGVIGLVFDSQAPREFVRWLARHQFGATFSSSGISEEDPVTGQASL
jgi:hypothetical protein